MHWIQLQHPWLDEMFLGKGCQLGTCSVAPVTESMESVNGGKAQLEAHHYHVRRASEHASTHQQCVAAGVSKATA